MRELEVARLESALEHKSFVVVIFRSIVVMSWETHWLAKFSNHRLLAVTVNLIRSRNFSFISIQLMTFK